MPCDVSCNGCKQVGNNNCVNCAAGYMNASGYCLQNCPNGTVQLPSTYNCGCSGSCLTCMTTAIFCLTCADPTLFAFQGNCYSTCPAQSYRCMDSII